MKEIDWLLTHELTGRPSAAKGCPVELVVRRK